MKIDITRLYFYNSLLKLFDLFQTRNEIKQLEEEAKALAENYDALKHERTLLLTEREKTFNGMAFLL